MTISKRNEINQFILYLMIGGIVGSILMGISTLLTFIDPMILTEDYYRLFLLLLPTILVALALIGITILMKGKEILSVFFSLYILTEIVLFLGFFGPIEAGISITIKLIFLVPFILIYSANSEIPAVKLALLGRVVSEGGTIIYRIFCGT